MRRIIVARHPGHGGQRAGAVIAAVGRDMPAWGSLRLRRRNCCGRSCCSERLLMEEMDYNLLFCQFVGLNADDAVRDATVLIKNHDRCRRRMWPICSWRRWWNRRGSGA